MRSNRQKQRKKTKDSSQSAWRATSNSKPNTPITLSKGRAAMHQEKATLSTLNTCRPCKWCARIVLLECDPLCRAHNCAPPSCIPKTPLTLTTGCLHGMPRHILPNKPNLSLFKYREHGSISTPRAKTSHNFTPSTLAAWHKREPAPQHQVIPQGNWCTSEQKKPVYGLAVPSIPIPGQHFQSVALRVQ